MKPPRRCTKVETLAMAVIIQAARDAAKGDHKARTWLLSPLTAETWGRLAELNWHYVRAWVKAGCHFPRKKLTDPGRQRLIYDDTEVQKIIVDPAAQDAEDIEALATEDV